MKLEGFDPELAIENSANPGGGSREVNDDETVPIRLFNKVWWQERISRDDGGFSLAARGNVNSIRCDESKFLKCPKEENLF